MLPIFLLIWSCAFREALSDTDTAVHPLTGIQQQGQNLSQSVDTLDKPSQLAMNGHNNYHIGQFFYLNAMDQLLPEKRGAPTNNKEEPNYRDDYLVTEHVGVHKLHRQKVTWNGARMQCILEGGHLAIINSNREEAVLLEMMSEHKLPTAWLGVHDLYKEGDWTSVLDEPLGVTGYTKWTPRVPNDPDNHGGNQNCAVLTKETGMDDIECHSTHAFLCELPRACDMNYKI